MGMFLFILCALVLLTPFIIAAMVRMTKTTVENIYKTAPVVLLISGVIIIGLCAIS